MAETVEKKPVFREAFQRHRCLVAVDNFYEWQKVGKESQRYDIALARPQRHGPRRIMGDLALAGR